MARIGLEQAGRLPAPAWPAWCWWQPHLIFGPRPRPHRPLLHRGSPTTLRSPGPTSRRSSPSRETILRVPLCRFSRPRLKIATRSRPSGFTRRPLALEDRGSFADAVALLQQAEKLDPGSLAILRRLSRIYIGALGRPDLAVEFGKKVLTLEPGDTDTLSRLVEYYNEERHSLRRGRREAAQGGSVQPQAGSPRSWPAGGGR